MASLREAVKDYQDELRAGIAWVVFWREGRSWSSDYIYPEVDDTLTPEDRSRLQEIQSTDPAAVVLNGYYSGYLGEDMSLEELTAGVRRHYENGYNNIADFIEAHDNTLSPEQIEEAREAAHAAGLPFSEKPYRDGDFDPYTFDGSMSVEDYELMHRMMNKERSDFITDDLTRIDTRSGTFNMQDIENRRFMYQPQTGTLILGRQYHRSGMYGSHAEDHGDSGAAEPFDSFIRGWIGTGKEYPHGIIHFAPNIDSHFAEQFDKGFSTLEMFAENGAGADTVIRGFGDAWEQPLSNLLPERSDRVNEQFSILIDSRNRAQTGEPGGVWLSMPATAEQLHAAMQSVGITADNPQDFFINGYFPPDGKRLALPYDMVCAAGIDELNFLAARLATLAPADLDTLNAAAQRQRGFENIGQIIDFTYNTDFFVCMPEVKTVRDLGDYYLNKSGMVDMPEEWKKGINLEAFGRNAAEQEHGSFTPYGYVVESGDQWERHFEGRDVPEEYRIMSFPQPSRPDPDKVEMDAAAMGQAQAAQPTEPRPVIPLVLTAEKPAEKIKEITDRLEQGITELFDSERYKDYLRVMSKFHNYSFRNTLLIAMQAPDASLVAGFNAWKNTHGRNVKKGEKGIKIFAPSPYKVKRETAKLDPQTQQPIIGKDGKPVTEEKEITVPAYKVVSVFDVSQTEGREIPSIGADELTGDVDRYKDFFAALEKTSPVPIGFENIEGSSHGYYHLEEKRIAIQEGMSELQTLKTAIHEIAHAKLHDIDLNAPKEEQGDRPDRRTREVQAESVAYTVCQHYGLDTSDYSFGYVAGWSSGKELSELKSSLETIRNAAAEIIDSIDANIAELQQAREAEPIAAEQGNPDFEKLTPEQQQEITDEVKATLQAGISEAALETPDALTAEPTVTIIWSESAELREGETMPLSRANTLFASLDEAQLASPGYDKTKFAIDYVMDGQPDHYEGRQDFGDGDGTLIDHIEKYHAHYENNADWDNHLLHTEGKEALEADKAQRAILLHEFVPYLKLHCALSEMEQAATAALQSGESLTPTETAYHTAVQAYVAECRGKLNSGDYELPPAPRLADFDPELQAYKEHVKEEITQEAAAAGMTVEEYAEGGYEPHPAPEQTTAEPQPPTAEKPEASVTYYPINEGAARRAKEAMSFSDYRPGSATAEYRHYVDKAAELAARQKKRVDPSFHAKIDGLLDTYARKLAANMNKGYEIAARVPSILIAGGSNFPVRKKQKQNAADEKNMQEFSEIQGLLSKIRSTGMGGISADDPNAISKLESKLAKREALQETMKAVNAYYRKHKAVDGCPHLTAEQIEKMKASLSSDWRANPKPFETYQLSNNSAEIRRLKERIATLTRQKEVGYVGWEFDGGKVEANAGDNRLQIFFDEKPDADTRDKLKEYGFKWSPSAGAWQRQLTDNAIRAADALACIAPLTGERPTEVQKRARQDAPREKAAAPEYIYKMEANPRSESSNDRFFLQAYLPQEDGKAQIGDVLYIGTAEKCREIMVQLAAGELTQGEVKELYAKAQEAEPDKDTFSIYQLKRGDETRDFRFEPYDRLQAAGLAVDPSNYDLIYTAPLTPGTSLEDIFTRFNIDHPADFKGHSLSVSDVVVLHQAGQDTAHYVDSIGYQAVPEFLREQQELTPDARMTGEQIRTPRGSFHVTDMTREQMEAAGYGFHHQSEDGKYFIMANGTQAFAVVAEPQQNYLKHIEDTVEQNDNSFDGIINNTPPAPTVDELEAKVQAGEQISLADLADALKAEKERGGGEPEKKPSIRAQLKADKERAAQRKTAAKAKSQDLERS